MNEDVGKDEAPLEMTDIANNEDSVASGDILLKNIKRSKIKKKQLEITGLATYIECLYARKGQELKFSPKIEKAICKQPRMSTDVRNELLKLAEQDVSLGVPRQLLLSTLGITGYTILHEEAIAFVGEVLKQHPLFVSEELQSVLNGELGVSALRALELLAKQNLPATDIQPKKKTIKAGSLKYNAVNSFAVWLAVKRKLSVSEVSSALFSALWYPEATKFRDEIPRLQQLTSIQNCAGIGLACQIFKDRATEAERASAASRDAERSILAAKLDLEGRLDAIQKTFDAYKSEADQLRFELEDRINQGADALMHLQNDYTLERARTLRKLNADVQLLSEGLHALRREEPRIIVMDDHADRVIESLKEEIRQLESGEGGK